MKHDRIHNQNFERLFAPESIVIAGASRSGSGAGSRYLHNLLSFDYPGQIHLLHREAKEIEGRPTIKSFAQLEGGIDYAYIAIPAREIADVLRDAKGRIQFAQIMTSGFREAGAEGKVLEDEMLSVAREGDIRLIGPNCLGTYCPRGQVTYTPGAPREQGTVAVVSQSGGLSVDVIRRGGYRGVRFSKVISIGNAVDIGCADLVEYFLSDSDTEILGLYVETVDGLRALLESIRRADTHKPVVLLRGGGTEEGRRAAESHTGALATNDRIVEDACGQVGVALVRGVDEFINTLLMLQTYYYRDQPSGRREVVLVGNGGGAGVVAADAMAHSGVGLCEISQKGREQLERLRLPAGASVKNPVDLPASVLRLDQGRVIGEILTAIGSAVSPTTIIVVHVNMALLLGDSERTEEDLQVLENIVGCILGYRDTAQTPIVFVLRAADEVVGAGLRAEYRENLRTRRICLFEELDSAARAVGWLSYLEGTLIRRAGAPEKANGTPGGFGTAGVVEVMKARREGRTILTEPESRSLLAEIGFGAPRGVTIGQRPPRGLVKQLIAGLKAPYVVKGIVPGLMHKTERGAIHLALRDANEVARAMKDLEDTLGAEVKGYLVEEEVPGGIELALGVLRDPHLGLLIMIGFGGVLMELVDDVRYLICPVWPGEVTAALQSLKVGSAIDGFRGKPAINMEQLERMIQSLGGEQGLVGALGSEISSIDINPLIADREGFVMVDAKVVLSQ